MTPPYPRFVLPLEALPDPHPAARGNRRDADYRLKLLLKHMLRALGFRCRGIAPLPPPNPPPAVAPAARTV